MDKQDLQDAVDFEVALAKLVLKDRSWAHNYKSMVVASGKSDATVSGVIKLTDKWLASDDRADLANDIKHQIAHLIAGVRHEHTFPWQYIANKLYVKSEYITLKAKETKECEYCGKLTVFINPPRCHQCKTIEDAVTSNPDVAAAILQKLGEL